MCLMVVVYTLCASSIDYTPQMRYCYWPQEQDDPARAGIPSSKVNASPFYTRTVGRSRLDDASTTTPVMRDYAPAYNRESVAETPSPPSSPTSPVQPTATTELRELNPQPAQLPVQSVGAHTSIRRVIPVTTPASASSGSRLVALLRQRQARPVHEYSYA